MSYGYFCDDAFRDTMQRRCKDQNKEYIDPADVTILEIDHGELKSLADLKWFPNLKNFEISNASLKNLNELAELPKLTTLRLEACDIEDITAIWGLNLSGLEIYFSNIGGEMWFNKLDKLKELVLFEIDLPDLTNFSMPHNLEELTLCECGLTDISFLNSIKRLRYISLGQNCISDISALKEMKKLESVYLWENKIVDLSPLKKLPIINRLSIGMNPIDWDRCSLNDFKSIRRITELWVDGLGLENIMLNRAKRIKKLTIGGKDCTDISFLKGLKHIEKIELIASAVEDISPLLELSKLKYLLLVNNVFITDYYPVHALRKAGKKVSISMHLGISFLKTKLEQSQLPITIPWQPFRI